MLGFEFYSELLEKLVELLKETLGESLVSVVLYGSVARGVAKPESDIDLLLIIRNPARNYHRRLDRVLDVQSRLREEDVFRRSMRSLGTEPRISYLILSMKEARENRYIYLDMVEDARILHDRGGFFAQRLEEVKQRLRQLGSKRVWLDDGTWYWDLKPDLKPGEVFSL